MYYLLYRDCENHYSICDDEGYMLSDRIDGNVYSTTIEKACKIAKIRKTRTRFTFDTNVLWEGDTILWYYPLETLENPRQNYPELFI